MTIYYTNTGDIRGTCGHRHRLVRTAAGCLHSDRRACASQGGYSDRATVAVGAEGQRSLNETEAEVYRIALEVS